jgi:hypothetical protein
MELKREDLVKYLGPPQMDIENEKRNKLSDFPVGQCNILSTNGFIGSVLLVQCGYDELNE